MHGLVLGKFLPPHQGHLYLVEFARRFADEVTVVVGSLPEEPIPGELRFRWMQELCPGVRVVHLTDENPQLPEQHPDFWEIWRTSLERVVARPVDLVFASEEYGAGLAQILGARFVPTNQMRDCFPISGTAVRRDPLAHWNYLPLPVKRHYQKRILLFGPESSGKTTLARELAARFNGQMVAEYARTWLRGREDQFGPEDMLMIARGQQASEEALATLGAPYLFCDTDALTTSLWSQELFGTVLPELESMARAGRYDLTLLLEPNLPWEADELRFTPHTRARFFERCLEALEKFERPYKVVNGLGPERLKQAGAAVESTE